MREYHRYARMAPQQGYKFENLTMLPSSCVRASASRLFPRPSGSIVKFVKEKKNLSP